MTDKFLSGWGKADGQIAKYIYECDSYEEAQIVEENARDRTDQKHINICTTKPYYNPRRYHVEWKNKENCPFWYEKGYFKHRDG